jgi:lipoprotein-releasing system ATP-binding protein
VLEGSALRKVYREEDGSELTILDGVEIEVRAGEAIAIIGASGAGKSTLLHLLGLLDRPTSGVVLLEGQDVSDLTARQLAAVRNSRIGFVFQFHHLLREFTALENVMMPLLIAGTARREASQRALELLTQVGLRAGRPQVLGAERRRAAACGGRPRAGEPAGGAAGG